MQSGRRPKGDEAQQKEIEFAYKYPFTEEAKALVGEAPATGGAAQLRTAKARIEEALEKGKLEYRDIRSGQIDSICSYAYARLLVSTIPYYMIEAYAIAEAKRSAAALSSDTEHNILRVAQELGISVTHNKDFRISLSTFLASASGMQEYPLVNQRLSKGTVALEKHELCGIMVAPMAARIRKGLPILRKEIPQKIIDYSKELKLPSGEERTGARTQKSEDWIERLLRNPIPDVRQRVVYLVLAPYLVNVKKLEVEEAYKIILNYIDRCRAIDPNTRITNAQIRYHCNYAKAKGRRPLSERKAEELLSSVFNFKAQ